MIRSRAIAAVVCAVGFGASATVLRAQQANLKGTAVIKGKVTLNGQAPAPAALNPLMAGVPFCANAQIRNGKAVAVADPAKLVYAAQGNAIPFAFVYVKEGPITKSTYDAPATPVTLDQVGCMYQPHVFGMVAGQPLHVKSSDDVSHNVNSTAAKKNPGFNRSQERPSTIKFEGKSTFGKPEEAIKFKCDVHSWMTAWCFVMAHPFFDVSKSHYEFPGKDEKDAELRENKKKWGTFEIKELPAGEYTLEAWHEAFETVTQKVTVKEGETTEIEIKMSPKKAGGAAAATQPAGG